MECPAPILIHGRRDAIGALAAARHKPERVTLVSVPGAALSMGVGWWKSLMDAARDAYPDVPFIDVLDCADGTGAALAALRLGLNRLILWPSAPGRDAVVAIAVGLGGFVLSESPVPGASPGRGGPDIPGTNGDKAERPG